VFSAVAGDHERAERRCLELEELMRQQEKYAADSRQDLARQLEDARSSGIKLRNGMEDAHKSIESDRAALAEAERALCAAEEDKARLLAKLEEMAKEAASPGAGKEAEQAVREEMARELQAAREALARAEEAASSADAAAEAAKRAAAEKHEADVEEVRSELRGAREALREAEAAVAKIRADGEKSCDRWERTCEELQRQCGELEASGVALLQQRDAAYREVAEMRAKLDSFANVMDQMQERSEPTKAKGTAGTTKPSVSSILSWSEDDKMRALPTVSSHGAASERRLPAGDAGQDLAADTGGGLGAAAATGAAGASQEAVSGHLAEARASLEEAERQREAAELGFHEARRERDAALAEAAVLRSQLAPLVPSPGLAPPHKSPTLSPVCM